MEILALAARITVVPAHMGVSPSPRVWVSSWRGRPRTRGVLSRQAMAERTSLSAARLSRVENGTSLLSLPEVDEWASAVGADTDARARLHQLAEAAHTPAVEAFRHGGPDLQRSALDLEARAGHVLTVQPTIVPALLQTVAYARAVLELADVTSQDIAVAVALRLRRHLELLHHPSKHFGFLLTEAALRWPAGDAHVMAAQYDRIAQISTLPNVTVGVIPLGRPVSALPWCDINLYEDLRRPGRHGSDYLRPRIHLASIFRLVAGSVCRLSRPVFDVELCGRAVTGWPAVARAWAPGPRPEVVRVVGAGQVRVAIRGQAAHGGR